MVSIPSATTPALTKQTISSLNRRVDQPLDRQNLTSLNRTKPVSQARPSAVPAGRTAPRPEPAPGGSPAASGRSAPHPAPAAPTRPPVSRPASSARSSTPGRAPQSAPSGPAPRNSGRSPQGTPSRSAPTAQTSRPDSGGTPPSRPAPAPQAAPPAASRPGTGSGSRPAAPGRPQPAPQPVSPGSRLPDRSVPPLRNPLRKGQKTPLDPQKRGLSVLKVCFGWNIRDPRCDMDASAFLLTPEGKVPDDSWFVFYGQTRSPEGSVEFGHDPAQKDREIIRVDLRRLDRRISRIVFVLTLDEALSRGLNFSMIRDAYVRVLDGADGREIVSYRLEEYYPNVTSMTLGELYLHGGQWKFNPVGNGVSQDLAGQCAIYGVEIC